MALHLDFSKQALADIEWHKRSGNKSLRKKLLVLLEEVVEHPFTGTGKPEQLKHDLAGFWSRRINREHRLVYKVEGKRVLIYSAKGHYL